MAILKSGYVYVWDKKRQRHNYQHRLVMEEFLHRDLLPSEATHHLNGDRQDNRIENLSISTLASHTSNHLRGAHRGYCFCGRPQHAKLLCNKHYMQVLRHCMYTDKVFIGAMGAG